MSVTIDNNSNLDEVIEVLRRDQGRLTASDREIPAEDIEQIKNVAWSVPVLQSENARKLMRNNNHVVCNMEILSENGRKKEVVSLKMSRHRTPSSSSPLNWRPRRESTRRRSSTSQQSAGLHYTYHEEIAFGMNQMAVSQPVAKKEEEEEEEEENEDEEEEEQFGLRSSESSYSDPEDSDEYTPEGPSSIDNNTNHYGSQRRTGRLRKEEKFRMTRKELEDRRKEANKTNSKRYNFKKKAEEANLTEEVNVKEGEVKQKTERVKETDSKIVECYESIRANIDISNNQTPLFTSYEAYLSKKESIKRTLEVTMKNDSNLKGLKTKLKQRKYSYEKAAGDEKMKRINTNTYGSRKSRALHSKNIASLKFRKAELELIERCLSEEIKMMRALKTQLAAVLQWRYVRVAEIPMSQEKTRHIDHLIAFLNSRF